MIRLRLTRVSYVVFVILKTKLSFIKHYSKNLEIHTIVCIGRYFSRGWPALPIFCIFSSDTLQELMFTVIPFQIFAFMDVVILVLSENYYSGNLLNGRFLCLRDLKGHPATLVYRLNVNPPKTILPHSFCFSWSLWHQYFP